MAGTGSPDVYIVRVDSDDDCVCVKAEGKGKTPVKGNRRRKRSRQPAAIVIEDSPPAATSLSAAMEIRSSSLSKTNSNSLPTTTESSSESTSSNSLLRPTRTCTTVEVGGPPPSKRQTPSTTIHTDKEAHPSLLLDDEEAMETSPPAATDNANSDHDFQLALQLNEQLNRGENPYSTADEELARKLQSEEYAWDIQAKSLLMADEKLAKKLQQEDDAAIKIVKATKIVVNHTVISSSQSSDTGNPTVLHPDTPVTNTVSQPLVLPSQGTTPQPSNWTVCPTCPPDTVRTYHLIDLQANSEEWIQISTPLTSGGYHVTMIQRIQNNTLWQRFQSERQLMLQGRPEGFDLNEKILYHTSRAEKHVICEEGLDQRLSRRGSFGCGIYFSDDPRKCDHYWAGRGKTRMMFACHVLLGDMKVYPRGHGDDNLRREPPKVAPRPGEPKTYDSVMGNVSGHNEYIVYNTYRVFLAYVLQYTYDSSIPPSQHFRQLAPNFAQLVTSIKARGILANYSGSITQSAAPLLTSTSTAACQICGGIPVSCVCGLNSKGQCKHCKKLPSLCTCPPFKTADGAEIPYRCLTRLFQGQVRWRERIKKNRVATQSAASTCSTSVGSSNNSKNN